MTARPAVLHVLSDWKWTGPAEPVVNLCRALIHRGFPVHFACAPAPHGCDAVLARKATERLIEPILDCSFDKRVNFLANRRDIRVLAERMDRDEISIVHVHASHDHYIASRAARRARCRPLVVRTNHTGSPYPSTFVSRWIIRGHTHAWAAYSASCLEADCRAYGIPLDRGVVLEGAVDLDRFHPGLDGAAMRSRLGFEPGHIVIGVAARIQAHRRYDLILDAFRLAAAADPSIRGLILGRGTRQAELVDKPLLQPSLAGRVVHPGFIEDGYEQAVAAMDAAVCLVPGADGSCRAVREAMAVGRPIIVSRRGVLPWLASGGRCGLEVDESDSSIAEAMLRLAREPELRASLGRAAAERARRDFTLERQASLVAGLYMRLAQDSGLRP